MWCRFVYRTIFQRLHTFLTLNIYGWFLRNRPFLILLHCRTAQIHGSLCIVGRHLCRTLRMSCLLKMIVLQRRTDAVLQQILELILL